MYSPSWSPLPPPSLPNKNKWKKNKQCHSSANAGDITDVGWISVSMENLLEFSMEKSMSYPGGGYGNPLQYFYLENTMDRGTWLATIHRVTKSQTQLKGLSTHACRQKDYWILGLGYSGHSEMWPYDAFILKSNRFSRRLDVEWEMEAQCWVIHNPIFPNSVCKDWCKEFGT